MQRVDQLILIFLGGAAAVYFLVSTIALMLRREFLLRSAQRQSALYKYYVRLFAEIVLRELPPLDEEFRAAATRNYYRSFLDPLKKELSSLSRRARRRHRMIIRSVLSDLADDLTGEGYERVVYFAEELGLPAEIRKEMGKHTWWIRAMAARQLGLIKALDASEELIEHLKDRHPVVRHQSAVSVLKILGHRALAPILWTKEHLSPWERLELSVVISEFGLDAVPSLVDALHSENDSVVVLATEMLGSLGFTEAVEPLLVIATKHRKRSIRREAIRALGFIGDQRAVEPLVRATRGADCPTRVSLLESLGQIGSSEAIPAVLEILQSGTDDEKMAAAVALGRCGTEGMQKLVELTASEDPALRAFTLGAQEELRARD